MSHVFSMWPLSKNNFSIKINSHVLDAWAFSVQIGQFTLFGLNVTKNYYVLIVLHLKVWRWNVSLAQSLGTKSGFLPNLETQSSSKSNHTLHNFFLKKIYVHILENLSIWSLNFYTKNNFHPSWIFQNQFSPWTIFSLPM